MELTFKDNCAADMQDRVCSILLSLSMMAEDVYKRQFQPKGPTIEERVNSVYLSGS